HPDEWDTYTRFYEAAAAYVRLVLPHVQVGVTVTFGGIEAYPEQVARLNATSDIFIMTYYPLNADFSPRDPEAPLTDFPLMLAAAGEKPLILQEVGYPAGTSLDSSEADQAAFVHHVFDAWATAGDRIPFLNFFAMGDFSRQMCTDFLVYYQLPDSQRFYDFLCTLGLRKADGTPKAGWEAFVEEGTKRQSSQ
ncbi:MAG: hypothetical protein H7X77_04110, partial [Anaerolineae bacterium]|nr:hypothetical protein [Anaerolineae bacterium]